MIYNNINLLLIINLIFLLISILLLNKYYILFNILIIIILVILNNYNSIPEDTNNCYLPTSENPYMNYNNDIKKKKACPFYKSNSLIKKYTNFEIFNLFYNQKNNLNFFNSAFYTKPITTYIHNYFPLINWSYKKSNKPFKINKINPKSYLIYKNNKLNEFNNQTNIDNFIKNNEYISNLSNNFIK